ncbi:MAG TPA: hypothetical protein PLB92_08485 [Rhodoglobus sp.]|nr:hypothetical protein [Rhodoglobus sp.]
MNTPHRLGAIRESLTGLLDHPDALVRTAVRLALAEMDLADAADDPTPHHAQVARLLDAVLNPVSESEPA